MNNFAVIFDMDGVLVDSTTINRESFDAILAQYNLSMKAVEQHSGTDHKGGSLRDILAVVESKLGVHFDLHEFSAQAAEYQFRKLQELPANREMRHLLEELHTKNIPMAVATSSLRWRASKILDALKISEYFDAVVTADDVTEHKPNPHVFLEAARRLKIEPRHCVVIEDADSGVEAAKRAGMAVVGFEQFNAVKGTLTNADLVINTFTALSFETLGNLANHEV